MFQVSFLLSASQYKAGGGRGVGVGATRPHAIIRGFMYEPIFDADTAAEEVDRKLLSPTACKDCGVVMDNGMDDICNDCWERFYDSDEEEDELCRA